MEFLNFNSVELLHESELCTRPQPAKRDCTKVRLGLYAVITHWIMRKINEDKLVELSTTNKMLDDKHGTLGTVTRNESNIYDASLAVFSLSFTASALYVCGL